MTRVTAAMAARTGAKISGRHSDAEELLAEQLRLASTTVPTREFQFHPTRKWRFDFAWPAYKIAVEVEGGIYPMKQADGTMRVGRHGTAKTFELDAEKYNAAAILGWCVLRVTEKMVKDGRALDAIQAAALAVAERRGIPTRRVPRIDDFD